MTKINKVTITGADNSIDPKELSRLSDTYPFVEWGILVSKKHYDTPRYPGIVWINNLLNINLKRKEKMSLSLHICGQYIRRLLDGDKITWIELGHIKQEFQRMQLNFHAENNKVDEEGFINVLKLNNQFTQYILQLDGVNDALLQTIIDAGINAVGLFDLSGGIGLLPESWPSYEGYDYVGYAGGLGPDNLKEQIEKILLSTKAKDIWIDMETNVRSDNDKIFDLQKVEQCLKIAELYIK